MKTQLHEVTTKFAKICAVAGMLAIMALPSAMANDVKLQGDQARTAQKVEAPKAVLKVNPVYPRWARAHAFFGPVTMRVHVSKAGLVTGVDKIDGNDILAESARDALKMWSFEPAKVDGRAVDSSLNIRVEYRINSTKVLTAMR